MRFVLALAGGLLITAAIFLFMQNLIKSRQEQAITLPLHSVVEILRQEPEKEEPEPEEAEVEAPVTEPTLAPAEIPSPAPELAPDLEMPALDIALGDIQIQSSGDRWQGPAGTGVGTVDLGGGGGEDAQGFIEVIPYDTRRPNVPEVAYRNKISGWVLVAFQVTAQGATRNVRVLDASPRGVFEEKVVAAVSDWKYRVNFYGGATGSVVLTQKVDVLWENYPQNMPNVD